eukprot:scaffold331_cov243-Pinguiococcus_pyrenoidosus.AAC.5
MSWNFSATSASLPKLCSFLVSTGCTFHRSSARESRAKVPLPMLFSLSHRSRKIGAKRLTSAPTGTLPSAVSADAILRRSAASSAKSKVLHALRRDRRTSGFAWGGAEWHWLATAGTSAATRAETREAIQRLSADQLRPRCTVYM